MGRGWTLDEAPDQSGRIAVVTGANSGLGLETARALRSKGATVLMACRSLERGQAALEDIVASGEGPAPELVELDLEDAGSIDAAVAAIAQRAPTLDLLINNAGVMGLRGPDGPRRQLQANLLGHVALAAALLPRLEDAEGRIVMLASNMHRTGSLSASAPLDIDGQSPSRAYGSTKLADLLFAFEADRRLRAAGSPATIRAAHPGWSRSGLAAKGPVEGAGALSKRLGAFAGAHLGQRTERGALPTLRAALDPSLPPGCYVGPDGFMEMWGSPVVVGASSAALDPVLAAALTDAALAATSSTWPA